MSTAEQIIAEHRWSALTDACKCGDPTITLGEHAAHVVAALTNAGKAIVELPEAEDYGGDPQWTLPCGTVSVDSRQVVSFEGDDICDANEAPDLAAALLAAARVAEGGEQP
ncbi:hypothetical protein [Prescottella equi]|uniref:Uncharacterized protein n=1 Tax=Rhodococcus phage REQ2 TaxID=1109713 RepID=G9FH09_9CAUD|nr:hypothetical protein [Prescottella equi]YP_005087110.1 hypothetical protein RoPhREQ2_gp66 [Rhodococcus phage REQ2]AEV51920.1 hypothetical protein [Rhodococcus phage REQ2]